MEEDLRARLTGNSAIAERVARKAIAYGDRPQASGLPAITFDTVADPRPQHMADVQALRSTRVQFDVWSKDRLEARDLRELVIAAILPAGAVGSTSFRRAFVNDARASFERIDNATIFRERIDATIWHAPA